MKSVPLLACCALAACASGERPPAPSDILGLYAHAYAEGSYGFSCTPAAYVGGPEHPRYTRLRERLGDRRRSIRERLARRFGSGRLDDIEDRHQEEMHNVHFLSCNRTGTRRARYRYRRLLGELERRLAVEEEARAPAMN